MRVGDGEGEKEQEEREDQTPPETDAVPTGIEAPMVTVGAGDEEGEKEIQGRGPREKRRDRAATRAEMMVVSVNMFKEDCRLEVK